MSVENWTKLQLFHIQNYYFEQDTETETNTDTAWKTSEVGVFLVNVFPHLDWIRRDTEFISPSAGKYGPEKLQIQTLSCSLETCNLYLIFLTEIAVIQIIFCTENNFCFILIAEIQSMANTELFVKRQKAFKNPVNVPCLSFFDMSILSISFNFWYRFSVLKDTSSLRFFLWLQYHTCDVLTM